MTGKPDRRTRNARLLLGAVLLLASSLRAAAADPGVWGEIGVTVLNSERVSWAATAEWRTDETFPRDTFLGRFSTSARFPVTRGWSLRAGYSSFLRGHGDTRLGWQKTAAFGVTYPLGTPKVHGSTIYEHHWLPAGLGERDRMRQRFEAVWPRKQASPWVYEDLTLENGRGLYRSRSRVGVSLDIPHGWQLRTGYQFQSIRQRTGAWAPRHAILLQLRLPTVFDLRKNDRRKKKASAAAKPSTPEPPEPPEPEETLEELDQQ